MSIEQYHNKKVTEVFLLKLLYIFASPLARFFIFLKIKPDAITTLSNISAIFSYIAIFFNFYLFAFFWILALILDICDGITARATDQSNAFGSFYDHFSDFLKILILYFVIALYFDNKIIWLLAILNAIFFSTVDYLDGIYAKRTFIINSYRTENLIYGENKGITKFIFKLNSKINDIAVYRTLFIMHGQYNLVLIPLAFNEQVCQYTFILTLLICLWTVLLMTASINQQSNLMIKHHIPWK